MATPYRDAVSLESASKLLFTTFLIGKLNMSVCGTTGMVVKHVFQFIYDLDHDDQFIL